MFFCITGPFVPPGMSLEGFWSKIRLPRILKNLFSARKGRFLVIASQQMPKKRQSPEPKSNSLRALREKNFPEIFLEFLHFGHVLGHWESVKRVFLGKKIWDFFKKTAVFSKDTLFTARFDQFLVENGHFMVKFWSARQSAIAPAI